MLATPGISRFSFGLFEADPLSGELWKSGRKIKLQSQPFKVLIALLEQPGEVVTREELQLRVWGKDTVVDFDHSLGTAINKIRDALGDSADNPRFVETLSKRGFRFIAPVQMVADPVPAEHAAPAPAKGQAATGKDNAATEKEKAAGTKGNAAGELLPGQLPAQQDRAALPTLVDREQAQKVPRPARAWVFALASAIAGVAALGGYYVGENRTPGPPERIEQLTTDGRIAPGTPMMESFPASATDGLRIFTSVIAGGRSKLAQVEIHTGAVQPLTLPDEIASPTLGDISPDGSKLLLRSHLSPESEQPLWIVPTGGGSALRIANAVAHDATWMPDGSGILYAAGNNLLIAHLQDGTSTPFAALPGRAFWLRWSPDGKLLRFTLTDPVSHTLGLWQIGSDGKGLAPILKGWQKPEVQCCGVWTGDGRYFIFQSFTARSSDLWRMKESQTENPVPVTNGPLSFEAPVVSRIGHRVFFLGLDTQSALERFDADKSQFVPERDFLAMANRIAYSHDGSWVAWTDAQGRLWRARSDGTETIQLTPDSLQVFLAHWAPDGSRLAVMARTPGHAWQLYTIAAEGGAPVRLLHENRNAADPSWSADGQQIVFGRVPDLMGKEEGPRNLEVLNLKNGSITEVPGSDGLFSPRWSPDGRFIAALTLDQRRLMLFDVAAKSWKSIADTSVADPVWTADSRAIFFHASLAELQPIYRISIPDGRLQQIANLTSFRSGDVADYFFCGITPGNVPIVRSRTATGNLYSLDLDSSRAR